MNPKFGRRSWVKLWVNEWLDGTTRFEMSDAQRAFWVDLLALAGRSSFPGVIAAGQVNEAWIGYPITKFQSLLSEPLDIEATLKLFSKNGKLTIEITHDQPIRLFKLTLSNWERYQSEYHRQKKYRAKEKAKKVQSLEEKTASYAPSDSAVTPESDTQSNKTEVEVEVEEEIKTKHIRPITNTEPEDQEQVGLSDRQIEDFFRELIRSYKRKVGRAFGRPHGRPAEQFMEACQAHGTEAIERAFDLYIEQNKDYLASKRRPKCPAIGFIYSIKDLLATTETETEEEPKRELPRLTR